MMRGIYTLILLLLFTVNTYAAGTCWNGGKSGTSPYTVKNGDGGADSCAYADVEYCVNDAAAAEETVNIPAGECTWSSQLAITKGVNIIGAGNTSTKITSNYTAPNTNTTDTRNALIYYAPTAPEDNDEFRLSSIAFDMNVLCGFLFLENDTLSPMTKIRVDNNLIKDISAHRAIIVKGTIYGVIYNNTFDNTQSAIAVYGNNYDSWTNLSFTYGTADNMYFEDNNFINHLNTPHSGGSGGRYCGRYNSYNITKSGGLYPCFDAHGNQPTGNHATMGVEIYGNAVTMVNNGGVGLFDHRGGMGLVFCNTAITTGSVSGKCREEYADSLNLPASGPTGQPQHVSDSYYWKNMKNYSTIVNPTEESDCCAAIAEGSEWFRDLNDGVRCGTLQNIPSTCTPGQGYWATNQSCSDLSGMVGAYANEITGTLYKCSANGWQPFYTPYTYPHPLRTGDTITTTTTTAPEPTTSVVTTTIGALDAPTDFQIRLGQ